jgi:methylmalonyl-CoA mutase, C-terminal domain
MATRPRIVIGMLGLDQHEIGAKVVAALLRDAGMEVVYLGKFNTPARLCRAAIDEAADVIGVSAHSWEYLEQVPELLRLLTAQELAVPVVVGGSVITPADADALRAAGVAAVFRAGAAADEIVARIRDLASSEAPASRRS